MVNNRGELCGIFKIVVVSAVKICKQCLQIVSVSGPPTGALFCTHCGTFVPQTSWAIAPEMKIPGVATAIGDFLIFRVSFINSRECGVEMRSVASVCVCVSVCLSVVFAGSNF